MHVYGWVLRATRSTIDSLRLWETLIGVTGDICEVALASCQSSQRSENGGHASEMYLRDFLTGAGTKWQLPSRSIFRQHFHATTAVTRLGARVYWA